MPDDPPVDSMEPIPLARPSLSSMARQNVNEVLRSSRLSRGPYLEAFEEKMAEQCGTQHAVAVSSGTAALHCIVSALDLEPGAEILTTPFSFVASTNVLLYENLQPRFVDIDPSTYNIDVERVERAITSQTQAILAVDVFGHPANWPALTALAEEHDLLLIDDACEALGGTVSDHPIGAWGTAAAFGFYPNKQITTGEGGCITTNDAELARRCRSLRNQGRADDGQMRHDRLGYNYRLDEMSAALGCAQLDRLDEILDRRRAVAAMYADALGPLKNALHLPPQSSESERSWFVYVVRLRDHFGVKARDRIMDFLQSNGIGCAPYFPAIHLQPYVQEQFDHHSGDFPVCERVSARTLALPFFHGMTREMVARVSEALKESIASISSQPVSQ